MIRTFVRSLRPATQPDNESVDVAGSAALVTVFKDRPFWYDPIRCSIGVAGIVLLFWRPNRPVSQVALENQG